MMDYDYKISEIRPKLIIDLLHKYTQLNDLNLGVKEDDENCIYGCLFGASRPQYEHKEGSTYGKEYGTATYHKHDFRIRINGINLFICKEHLKFLSTMSKELSAIEC